MRDGVRFGAFGCERNRFDRMCPGGLCVRENRDVSWRDLVRQIQAGCDQQTATARRVAPIAADRPLASQIGLRRQGLQTPVHAAHRKPFRCMQGANRKALEQWPASAGPCPSPSRVGVLRACRESVARR